MILDQIAGALAGIAGFSLGMREIMLSPRNVSFPVAPPLVRLPMFAAATVMAGTSLLLWCSPGPGPYAGRAAGALILFMAGCAGTNLAQLVNIVRQRYRPEVWARLNRATETVKRSCRRAEGGLRLGETGRRHAEAEPLRVMLRR